MSISEIPKHKRPREKALLQGFSSLNDEELLALFIRVGTKDFDAIQVANNLLKEYKSFYSLSHSTINELLKIKGIGKIKAIEILAIFEIAERINSEIKHQDKIGDQTEAIHFAKPFLANQVQEKFFIIYLNHQNELIHYKVMYSGTQYDVSINPIEIFELALKVGATKFYAFHNHPSGNPLPSKADMLITQRIMHCSKMFGIPLINHIILTRNESHAIL